MGCTACGDKPKNDRHFPGAVIEINNPERLIAFRKVVIPASLGDDTAVPASIGKYRNVILYYEANSHVYLYSSDGIPTLIAEDIGDLDELWEAIEAEEFNRAMADAALEQDIVEEAAARASADSALSSSVDSLSSSLSSEITAREAADVTLQGNIDAEASVRQTADANLQDQIDDIEEVIPAQASASNQLADKDFVNSSIATNTANFIGTFNSVAELEAYTGPVTNNDYAFVIVTDAQGNTAYDRYKYNGDTEQWLFEYELNNSSFTANQWAAINSGITSGDVTKLAGLANIQTIGANLTLTNGELSATDTTYAAGNGLNLTGTTFSADTTVLATQADLATKQDTLTAGNNIQISGSTISATDTTYSDFTGTDGTAAGAAGLVPAPATTDAGKFLKADGTWDTAGSAINVVQTTGTSTTDVMSQNAVTSMVFADPDTQYKIKIGAGASDAEGNNAIEIGHNAAATATNGIALGYAATTSFPNAIAIGRNASSQGGTSICIGQSASTSSANATVLGSYANAGASFSTAIGYGSKSSAQGEVGIGLAPAYSGLGYNSSDYRLLTGLYDPQNAHDAATKGYVDTAIAGAGGASEINSTDWSALWQ